MYRRNGNLLGFGAGGLLFALVIIIDVIGMVVSGRGNGPDGSVQDLSGKGIAPLTDGIGGRKLTGFIVTEVDANIGVNLIRRVESAQIPQFGDYRYGRGDRKAGNTQIDGVFR